MPFRKFSEQFAVPKKNFGTLLPPHYLKTYDFSGWLSIRNEIFRASKKTVQISKIAISISVDEISFTLTKRKKPSAKT